MTHRLLALLAALTFSGSAVSACGAADDPCVIDSGTYHVLLPEIETPKGAVMLLHGGGGRAVGLLGSGTAKEALARGFIFIAPQGFQEGERFEQNWAVRADNFTPPHDDIGFLNDVMDQVSADHGAPRDQMLVAGFSRGGSMAWVLACFAPGSARAYAPSAGAFWDTLPTKCEGPVDLFHTHGWNDRTVPLEGRPLFNDEVYQGDVWESLKILRATNGCASRQPSRSEIIGDRWWRHWEDCEAGRIDLMLHPGGHGTPSRWAATMMDWFEARLSE